MTATAAFAAPTYNVALGTSRTSIRYGQEFVLYPSVVGTSTLALSTVTIEKSWDGVNWNTDGLEGLKAEGDTGTVVPLDPQHMITDESLLPAGYAGGLPLTVYFRAIYKPVGLTGAAIASENQTSAPTAITLVRQSKVKAFVSVPKNASYKRAFTVASSMSPNCGPGTIQVTITKKGFKKVYVLATDDSGTVDLRVKLKKGSYKVQSRWAGNIFGPGAKSATKTVRVR
jgi:hypothetical protein